jgi:flagellar biosynthesis/type III secretory pathway chaperone
MRGKIFYKIFDSTTTVHYFSNTNIDNKNFLIKDIKATATTNNNNNNNNDKTTTFINEENNEKINNEKLNRIKNEKSFAPPNPPPIQNNTKLFSDRIMKHHHIQNLFRNGIYHFLYNCLSTTTASTTTTSTNSNSNNDNNNKNDKKFLLFEHVKILNHVFYCIGINLRNNDIVEKILYLNQKILNLIENDNFFLIYNSNNTNIDFTNYSNNTNIDFTNYNKQDKNELKFLILKEFNEAFGNYIERLNRLPGTSFFNGEYNLKRFCYWYENGVKVDSIHLTKILNKILTLSPFSLAWQFFEWTIRMNACRLINIHLILKYFPNEISIYHTNIIIDQVCKFIKNFNENDESNLTDIKNYTFHSIFSFIQKKK